MPLINVHCNFCEEIFSSMHTLNVHTAISHAGQLSGCGCDAHCDQCTSTFSNATLLNTHIKEHAESERSSELEQERVGFLQPSTISGDNLIHTSENEHHVRDHIDVPANDWSYIFQADGNATIGTLSDAGDTVENIDMHLPPTHSPRTLSTPVAGLLLNQLSSSMSGNKTFDYSLNPLQQTKRLMDNAPKPSM